MSEPGDRDTSKSHGADSATDPRVVRSEELFKAEREVCIEHAGVRYRLRITRRNKLILQK
jgi:hemin uptake protein HemP